MLKLRVEVRKDELRVNLIILFSLALVLELLILGKQDERNTVCKVIRIRSTRTVLIRTVMRNSINVDLRVDLKIKFCFFFF